MQIKKKEDKFAKLSKAERDRKAEDKIRENKERDAQTRKPKSSLNAKKAKRVKNVRKDEKLYENMIFAAFEKESCLNQEDFFRKTGEPWNFLRPVVNKLCDRVKNAEKGNRSWVLKEEFRLATDNAVETSTETAAQ